MNKKRDVTVAQAENMRSMANSKGLTRAVFQRALDDGRFSDFLDDLGDSITVNVESGRLTPFRTGAEYAHDFERQVGSTNIQLAEFLNPGEESINFDGKTLSERIKGTFLGERSAKAILARRHRIPNAWKQYRLVLPATGWRVEFGRIVVPCLYWIQEEYHHGWNMEFVSIMNEFDRKYRILIVGK